MLKSILIGLLMLYILFGSFLTIPKKVQPKMDALVLIVFMLVCLSLYLDETMIALLGIIAFIVYVYSVGDKSKMNIRNKLKQHDQSKNQILKKENVVTKEKLVDKKETSSSNNHTKKCTDDKPVQKKFHGNLKTQSNIFNKLNYDLHYNELGDQFNIQGFDDVKGFDKSIYN